MSTKTDINHLVSAGKFTEALSYLDGIIRHPPSTPQDYELLLLKANTLRFKGDLYEAASIIEEMLEAINDELRFHAFIELAYIYFYQGSYVNSLSLIQSAEFLWHAFKRENEALSTSYATLHHLKGINLVKQQDLTQGFTHLVTALELREKLGVSHDLAYSYFNVGLVRYMQGKLTEAYEWYEKSYSIHLASNNNMTKGFLLTNMGLIKVIQGDLDEGNQLLQQGLVSSIEYGNGSFISEPLYELVYCSLMMNNLEQANNYLQQLEKLYHQEENPIIELRYRLALALYKLATQNLRDLVDAKDLLEKIVQNKSTDFEYRSIAIRYYCDVLLTEFNLFENKDTLDQITLYLVELEQLASNNAMFQLEIEAKLIHLRLQLVLGNVEEAKQVYEDVVMLSDKHQLDYGMPLLDSLLGENVESQRFSSMNFRERVEELRIKDYLRSVERFIRKRNRENNTPEDE